MEYEVVDKDEGTMDGSSWEAICEEKKEEIAKDATIVMKEKIRNQHPMTKRICCDISIKKV